MLSNISSYFHVLISLGALLTSSNNELLSPETDGVFSHCFRKSINFFYKGPGSHYFRFLGHIWFLEQILFVSVVVCSFTCFTSLGTYENHSQLTGHERLTPIHTIFSVTSLMYKLGEGWPDASACTGACHQS